MKPMKGKKRFYIERRPVFVFGMICFMIAALMLRLAFLQTGADSAVRTGTDEKRILIDVSRGYIYDRDMRPLVNTVKKNVAAVLINAQTRELFAGLSQIGDATAACVTMHTDAPVRETPFSLNIETLSRYGEDMLCTHIIGYVDASGRGVCGIEKSFDKLLQAASGSIYVKYAENAVGQPIAGEGISAENEGYGNPAGIALTVDAGIQRIVQDALERSGIRRGAAVVLDVGSAEILAIASVPAYDVYDLAASLKDEDLPFLNRALAAYPVGSVFKPFVAAAALENGVPLPADYVCTGSTAVGNETFRCYRATPHGTLDIAGAVCRSCNCYFVDLGQTLGAQPLTALADKCGFGREIRLTGDLIGAAGSLPDAGSIGAGELANLCFGQGALTASPLQLAAAYNTLASGGVFRAPTLMNALIDGNGDVYARYRNETAYRALKENTCDIVNDCLLRNTLEGTGKNGASESFYAAGKTATAQTGRYDAYGKESLCTWFCGFFPYEAPKYTVVVFNEDGTSAAEDCAPVFRRISEEIYRQVGW